MDPTEVREAIRRLPNSERALLRPWMLARFDVRGYDREQVGWNPDDREGTVLTTALSHLELAQRQLREILQNVGGDDHPATTIELLGVVLRGLIRRARPAALVRKREGISDLESGRLIGASRA